MSFNKTSLRLVALVAGVLVAGGSSLYAQTQYTWTNTLSDSSGYWTNGVLWGNLVTDFPGSAANTPNAWLTNDVSGAGVAYTNILNASLTAAINSLVISNGNSGEAWLIVTNNGTGLVDTSFVLGNGGRLQLDNGGVVTGITTFAWTGRSGAIYLNTGGKLFTAPTAGITIGSGAGSVTALVSSVSGAGSGGVWNMGNKAFNVGGGTTGNVMSITGGAVVTNAGSLTLSGNQNGLLATNGGKLFGSGAIAFNGSGNTVNLGAGGGWKFTDNFSMGNLSGSASNNTLIGGSITMAGAAGHNSILIGDNAAFSITPTWNNNNSLIVTNAGGGLFGAAIDLFVGANYGGNGLNGVGGGNNTTVILSNSVFALGNSPGVSVTIGNASTNNSLTLLANTVVNGTAAGLGMGAYANAATNVMFVNGALVTNTGPVKIGSATAAVVNQLVIYNGGIVSNVTALTVGGATGASGNSLIVTNDGKFSQTSGAIGVGATTLGGIGGGGNTVLLSNSVLNATGASYIGVGSSNNTVTLLASTWNQNNTALTIGSGAAAGNIVTINGGILTNVNTLTFSGNRNSLIVTNGGKVFGIGAITLRYDTGGSAANGNTILLGAGLWNLNNNSLVVGGSSSFGGIGNASNNTFISLGATVTNANGLIVGATWGDNSTGNNNNTVIFTNGGGFYMTSPGNLFVGADRTIQSGGNNNTVILSNSVLWGNSGTGIGVGSSNNTLTLLANTAWNNSLQPLGIGLTTGFGSGVSNMMLVSGAVLSNFTGITVGSGARAAGNQLVVNNGGILSNFAGLIVGSGIGADGNSVIATSGVMFGTSPGAISVGFNGGGNNTLILSNGLLTGVAGGIFVGGGSSNNVLTLLGNTVLNANSGSLVIGIGAAYNNVVTIDGALFTNLNTAASLNDSLMIGYTGGSISNRLVIQHGGVMSNVPGLVIGGAPGANYNSLIVTNGGSLFMRDNGFNSFVLVGAAESGGAGGGNNTVIISNSLLVTRNTFASIGVGSSNNTVTLLADATWNAGSQGAAPLIVGSGAAVGNVLTLHGGVVSNASSLAVGSGAGANNNSVVIDGGGLLQIDAFTIGGGTGNTISNRNATYQFTIAGPGLTSLTRGDIAITDGTISFRGINNADVSNNLGLGALSKIVFAGANTFQLNAASNTTAGQTYTFQAIAGNPSNYVNLVMVNGATAYRGGDLTIGNSGSLLISNTTANVTGLFTNRGQTKLVSSTAGFANGVINSAGLSLQNATLTGSVTNLAGGTLQGNGLIVGNVTSFGTNSPGFSVGTLSITGNLTLASSAVTMMELSGGGTNDLITVSQLFTYAGQLIVTNITGFAYADGQTFQLFQFGSHSGDFSVTNLPDLTAFNLEWYTAQLGTTGLLIIVPEPSALVLLGGGILILCCFSRLRRNAKT